MKVILAALALATLTFPATATAAPSQQSMAVDIGDLDLTSDKGQRILALRIHRAVRALCDTQALESLPLTIRSERRCIREARQSALAAVRTADAAGNPARRRGARY